MNHPGIQAALSSVVDTSTVSAGRDAKELIRLSAGGDAYAALQRAIGLGRETCPAGHDVLVEIDGVFVTQTEYHAPHVFLFDGYRPGPSGAEFVRVILHFSQLKAHVVHRKTEVGKSQVVTGFAVI